MLYRQKNQEQILPKKVQKVYQSTQQLSQRLEQQPRNIQNIVQQSISNKPIQPLRHQQMQQQMLSEQRQQYSLLPQSIIQKDQDLQQKLQYAFDQISDLVLRYQSPQQQKKQPTSHKDEQEQQELTELALQYEDFYIYQGQGYEPLTREGYGVLTDQNGNEVYKGYWHDDTYHGQGKLNNLQTQQIDGPFIYKDMDLIGDGWLKYEGEFQNGWIEGFGILYLTNGEKFEGTFKNGTLNGKGVYTTIIGQTINGVWKDGRFINYI